MASPSLSPSPKPPFRPHPRPIVRRPTAGFSLRAAYMSESSTTISDSTTKGSSLKVGTTLEPQITPLTDASPVPGSPEASRPSPIAAPSPLGTILDHHPGETPAPVPRVPLESTGAEQDIEVLTASNASGSGSPGNNSQTSGPSHQPQVNRGHVTREDGPVSGDFSETEHDDEEFLRQTARRNPLLPPRDPINQQGEGQLGDTNDAIEMGKEGSKSPLELSPLLALPLAPTNHFPRGEFVNEVLDFTDQTASAALFGPIGVGKSSVALTLLHHNRTEVAFGRNRYFMHCDNLTNSLEDFLERLSDTIHANRTTDIAQLRSHLDSSPPLILLLDGVDLILDPLAPGAEEILAAIEEFGSYENVCLLTTSRIYPDIPGFHRVEVPTLSEDSARDTFYGLCNMSRSPAVDDLIARLDFHPLSIDFLAGSVRENNWDEVMLLKAWGDDRVGTLKTNYYQRMREAMEPFLHSPTIQNIETSARTVLWAVAAYPCGFEERRLQNTFANVIGIGEIVNVLCKFSLVYRQDGFVKMLSPFQFYFLESLPVEPPQHPDSSI